MLKIQCKTIKILQNTPGMDLTGAAAWSNAIDLGDLKGKVFLSVDITAEGKFETQRGTQSLRKMAKILTSSIEVGDATLNTALKAMDGKNVSLQVTPYGAVSATNPIIIIQDFLLILGGKFVIGGDEPSVLTIEGEVPCNSIDDVVKWDVSSA
jgi:hypothetical protein